jgi:hypothetical protein
MAKSFVLMGREAGFAMESPEGMQAWVQAYNATIAPKMAAPSSTTREKSRGATKRTMRAWSRKKKRTQSE